MSGYSARAAFSRLRCCSCRPIIAFLLCYCLFQPVICTSTNEDQSGAKVECSPSVMRIELPITKNTTQVYVSGLRDYPNPECRPHSDPKNASNMVLEFDLHNFSQCAIIRSINKQTGKQIFYQSVVIESTTERKTWHLKCSIWPVRNHTLTRRNVLPAGFKEPEELEITTSLTKHAPEPVLGVGVRQAGKLVTGELNVSPGTPLQMEIYLDKASAPIYGLLVTYMQVTDTNTQEETIIYNGCSVDPYLFENFNTVDGDFLAAKFRAFKFPESTYVQFKGTVNVCLDKCTGVECSDGQIGYGRRRRRRRSVASDGSATGNLYEITITSFIKVDYDSDAEQNNPAAAAAAAAGSHADGSMNRQHPEMRFLHHHHHPTVNNKRLLIVDNKRYYETVRLAQQQNNDDDAADNNKDGGASAMVDSKSSSSVWGATGPSYNNDISAAFAAVSPATERRSNVVILAPTASEDHRSSPNHSNTASHRQYTLTASVLITPLAVVLVSLWSSRWLVL